MKVCICKKSKEVVDPSRFVLFIGLLVIFCVLVELFFPGFWILPFLFLFPLYLLIIIVNIYKKHSFLCAVRKSFIDITLSSGQMISAFLEGPL
ncbi:MAG TPA: hypothetical protein VJ841_04795 [Candidatus Saccharimonadales bacterium]|nr:hypothetical protein [Candidatus Saccharimonadales bacterium]